MKKGRKPNVIKTNLSFDELLLKSIMVTPAKTKSKTKKKETKDKKEK
jgi:hypothetical protein